MIVTTIGFFNTWALLINFICHLVVFVGLLYVSVHNRELDTWVVTPLWYLGMCSGFVAVTIITQWVVGPQHPMSYWTFGQLGEIAGHILLAGICFVMFVKTIKSEILDRKLNKQ